MAAKKMARNKTLINILHSSLPLRGKSPLWGDLEGLKKR
jgi:hypothetical protein